MYFDGSNFRYNRPVANKVEKIEYAEMKHVKALSTRIAVLEERESKLVKNVSEMHEDLNQQYNATDELKDRVARCEAYCNAVEYLLNNARTATKKRRRVTVCAGDQRVEVIRND